MDLRSYRKQHGLTLDAFGGLVGVTGVTIHRWEVGKARPSLDAVELIQRATRGEVSAADFMRRDPTDLPAQPEPQSEAKVA